MLVTTEEGGVYFPWGFGQWCVSYEIVDEPTAMNILTKFIGFTGV